MSIRGCIRYQERLVVYKIWKWSARLRLLLQFAISKDQWLKTFTNTCLWRTLIFWGAQTAAYLLQVTGGKLRTISDKRNRKSDFCHVLSQCSLIRKHLLLKASRCARPKYRGGVSSGNKLGQSNVGNDRNRKEWIRPLINSLLNDRW